MASDPDIIPRGQYRNDQHTPIAIGASTVGDGVSNNVWLDADIYSSTPGSSTNINVEVKPVGTTFSGTATTVGAARILKETSLPTLRRGGNLIYDAKNKRFVYFGGYDGTTRYNETWELSADSSYSRWHKLAPTGTAPTARNLAAATFVRGTTSGSVDKAYMIIWGGASPSDSNDMYSLDVSVRGSEAWTTITQTSTPATRSYIIHHMVAKVTASNTNDIYLFGGWGTTRTNDLVRCTFDVNSPGAVTWTTLKANGTSGNPSGRSGTGMIYDSVNDRLIITCGYNGTTYLADTWQYSISGAAFTQLSPTGTAPAGRELPSIGYDATNQRAIVIGGWQGSATTNRNDIFQLSLISGSEAWTQIKSNDVNNQGVLAFSSGSAAVDTSRNIMVVTMISGYDATNKYTYAYDLTNTSTTAPLYGLTIVDYLRARDAPAFTYNSVRSELVMVNGYSAMDDDATSLRGDHVSEVWAYDRTNDKWRYAAKGPFSMTPYEGVFTIYDTANDRIICFGGLTGTAQRTNDVWQLKADVHGMYQATKLTPTGTAPPQRWLAAGCYDATNQRMIVTCGNSSTTQFNDVWALNLTLGSEAWTQLSPTGTAPTAVWQPCFAYDSGNSRLYVHAGCTTNSDGSYSSQLFYLDTSTTNCAWTNTGVTGGLAVRGAALAYDATNQRLVCFGGYDGTSVNNTVRYTSTSSFTSWTTQATANTPAARRSCGYWVVGGVFTVGFGRPPSGTWFSDTQELNYTAAPASWSWTAKAPLVYEMMSVAASSLTASASYHWQGWGITGATTGASASFGGNSESSADFVTSGSGASGNIKVDLASIWTAKPVKVWNGSSWVAKPVKVWNGSAWIQTKY